MNVCISLLGSFGRVYRGKCRNKIVAIKRYFNKRINKKKRVCTHLRSDGIICFCSFTAIEQTPTAQSQMWTCSAERFPSSVASITPASSSSSGRAWMTPASLQSSPSTSLGAPCFPCCMSRRGDGPFCLIKVKKNDQKNEEKRNLTADKNLLLMSETSKVKAQDKGTAAEAKFIH